MAGYSTRYQHLCFQYSTFTFCLWKAQASIRDLSINVNLSNSKHHRIFYSFVVVCGDNGFSKSLSVDDIASASLSTRSGKE